MPTNIDSSKTEFCEHTFSKLDNSGQTIQNKLFENCTFISCNFNGSTFLDCKFVECEFEQCNLSSIILSNTSFAAVVFANSKLLGINWATAKWPQIALSSLINFYACNISHSSFFGLKLAGINLQECKAHDVDFREADLSSSNFFATDLHQAIFMRTNLAAADFTDAINYNIDPTANNLKAAIFSFPDVINLLHHFSIKIKNLSFGEGEN